VGSADPQAKKKTIDEPVSRQRFGKLLAKLKMKTNRAKSIQWQSKF
jgi:hypothetical protein